MAYAALSLIAALVARLPSAARARVGGALGFIAGSVLRIRRSLVEAAMARAGISDPRASAAAMYRSLGEALVELLALAEAPPPVREDAIARVVIDPDSIASLDRACACGPVLLFASHTGNWELAAAAAAKLLATRGKRLAVVAKPIHARGVDAFVRRIRERCGIELVSPRGALAAARRVLAAGDVVVMPIDQVPERSSHGVVLPFLGEGAVTDRAPATLAWRARATALVVVAERIEGRDHVRVLDAIEPPGESDTARVWIDAVTRRATLRLERFVRDVPPSWLWLHRRWRAPLSIDRRPGRPPLVAPRQAG